MRKFALLRRDLQVFFKAWGRFLYLRIYRIFGGLEVIKRIIAKVLYKQRGRFARPFVHTAMGGVVALAISLAPVLASTFPGVSDQPAVEVQERSVMDFSEGTMETTESDKLRDKVEEYVVKNGDTASSIAEKYGISVDTIKWENNLTTNSIKPGQKLRILPVTGVRHVVTRGETIYTIAKKYSANPQSVVDFPFNTFADNETFSLAVGQDLIVPDGEKPNEVPTVPRQFLASRTPNAGAVSATGQFVWPISGTITQRYSWYHRGIDIATSFGAPILAADSGTVIVAGWPDNSGYGNRIVIDHGNGLRTWYGHLSRFTVTAGQTVKRGDVIGYEGSTGRSTGPHLHFEIRQGNTHLNPLNYLK